MAIQKYIYWKKECPIQHIDIDGFNKKIEELKALKYIKVPSSTIMMNYPLGSYSVKKEHEKYLTVAVLHKDMTKEFFTTNWRDDAKNKNIGQGTDAFNAVNSKFTERTGYSITKAFGSVVDSFKFCVPRQFYFIDSSRVNQIMNHISAIDFCSMYPSSCCGRLPDGHPSTMMRYKGTVKPTKEYPFAFYLKSGHVAIYREFDTHNWTKSLLSTSLFGKKESFDADPFMNPFDDETVLMKASKFTFEPEMQYYYDLRKTEPVAKLVMNAFIGMLHTESYTAHKQAHIAAVVIARSNNRMLEMAEKIGIENIVHLCVDGCIYLGQEKYGGEDKALKLCYQEFHDCDFKMIGMNSYVAMKENKVIKFKHGAYDCRTDGKDINICENFNDMKYWRRHSIKEEYINGL